MNDIEMEQKALKMSNEKFTPDLIVCPFEILSDERLTLRHIRTLLAIFSWRKKNTSTARVSREMLSERTGYPVTRVSQITSELEQMGWLKKTGNGGKSQWSEYQICDIETSLNSNQNGNGIEPSNGNQNGNGYQIGNGYQNGNQTVTDLDSNGYQNGNQTVTDLDSNGYQNGNQTVTKTVRGIDTGIVQEELKTGIVQEEYPREALPEWLDVELWNDWLDSRKKLKAQNSPRAIAIILKKLTDWHKQGHNPNSLIETALVNGWKDCYLPRQANSTKPQDDGYADFVAQTERWEAMQGGNHGNHNAIEGAWQ
jgi:hypothetical protein